MVKNLGRQLQTSIEDGFRPAGDVARVTREDRGVALLGDHPRQGTEVEEAAFNGERFSGLANHDHETIDFGLGCTI